MNIEEHNIKLLISKRQEYLDIKDDSWDEELCDYTLDPKEIDELSEKIHHRIKKHRDELDVDFIVETLTHMGGCPSILYDDNGFFAVASDGFQNVVFGDEPSDVDISHHITKDKWKKTIREALYFYLDEE